MISPSHLLIGPPSPLISSLVDQLEESYSASLVQWVPDTAAAAELFETYIPLFVYFLPGHSPNDTSAQDYRWRREGWALLDILGQARHHQFRLFYPGLWA